MTITSSTLHLGYIEITETQNLRVGSNFKDMYSKTSSHIRIYAFYLKKKSPVTTSINFIVKYLFPDEADHFVSKKYQ